MNNQTLLSATAGESGFSDSFDRRRAHVFKDGEGHSRMGRLPGLRLKIQLGCRLFLLENQASDRNTFCHIAMSAILLRVVCLGIAVSAVCLHAADDLSMHCQKSTFDATVEGQPCTLNLEYASRFFADAEDIPHAEWHFRWYPGRVENSVQGETLLPDNGFTSVLREAPTISWRVYANGQPVGWFIDRFDGLLPDAAGEWGLGFDHPWPRGWGALFSYSKTRPATLNFQVSRQFALLVFASTNGGKAVSLTGECQVQDRDWTTNQLARAGLAVMREEWRKRGADKPQLITQDQMQVLMFDARSKADARRQDLLAPSARSVSWEYTPPDPLAVKTREVVATGVDLREPQWVQGRFGKPLIQGTAPVSGAAGSQPAAYSTRNAYNELDRAYEEAEDRKAKELEKAGQ